MSEFNIQELKEFLQSDKRKRMRKMWGHTLINQNTAFYITYLLIKTKTKITPNQITIIFTLLGLLGAFLLFQPIFWVKILGLFLCWMNLVLDGVDGDYARYKKIFSLRGIYVDAINHIVVPPLLLLGLGFGLLQFHTINQNIIIYSVSLGAISWAGIKMISNLAFHLYGRHFKKDPSKYEDEEKPAEKKELSNNNLKQKNIIRRFLGHRFQFRQYFIAIIIFLITLFLDRFAFNYYNYLITTWAIVIYSIFLITQFIEESIKGYFNIEKLVKNIHSKS